MKRALICLLALACLLTGCGKKARTVLSCEAAGYTMDEDQFQFFFGYQYATALETLGAQAFDPAKPLADQSYDDTQSWQDFLLTQALNHAAQTAQLCIAAQAAGFTIGQAQSDQELAQLTAQTAKENGYVSKSGAGDPQAYLTACFGAGASLTEYGKFLQSMSLAEAYSDHLHESLTYRADEVEAFYDAHAADYADSFDVPKTDVYRLDVRMIYFYPNDPGSDRDWAQAEARATKVLNAFRATPTDEQFAALSDANTERYNAPAGGLYEKCTPGRDKGAVYDWLFPADTVRSPGDVSLIRDDDVLILCYVSAAEETPYWRIVAEQDMRYADYITAFSTLQETYTIAQYPDQVTPRVPTAHVAADDIPDDVEAVG